MGGCTQVNAVLGTVRAGRLVTWPGAAGRHGLDLVLELGET